MVNPLDSHNQLNISPKAGTPSSEKVQQKQTPVMRDQMTANTPSYSDYLAPSTTKWRTPELVKSSYAGSQPAQDAGTNLESLPPAPDVMQSFWRRYQKVTGFTAPAPMPRGQALLEVSGHIKQLGPNSPQISLQTEDDYLKTLAHMNKLTNVLTPFYAKCAEKPTPEEQESIKIVGGELCKTLGLPPAVVDSPSFKALLGASKALNSCLLTSAETSSQSAKRPLGGADPASTPPTFNGMALFMSFKNQLATQQQKTNQIIGESAANQTALNLTTVDRTAAVTQQIANTENEISTLTAQNAAEQQTVNGLQNAAAALKTTLEVLGAALAASVLADFFTLGAASGLTVALGALMAVVGAAYGGLQIAIGADGADIAGRTTQIGQYQQKIVAEQATLKGLQASSQLLGTMCSNTTQSIGTLVQGQIANEKTANSMFTTASQTIRASARE